MVEKLALNQLAHVADGNLEYESPFVEERLKTPCT